MVEVSSGNKLTSEVNILLLITAELKYLNTQTIKEQLQCIGMHL